MNKIKISNKELEILKILWDSDQPLTAKQIYEGNSNLVLSTIQATIKKLMQKKLLEVSDIVYSGTVLTRSYSASVSKEEFVLTQFEGLEIQNLLSLFLGKQSKKNLQSEIQKIEELLEKKRK